MRFKEYLNEMDGVTPGEVAPSPTMVDDKTIDQVNFCLDTDLDKPFLSPESGIQAIRKVLSRFEIDLPALYGANSEGDEIVMQLSNDVAMTNIYILYYLTDDNHYEFYAEIGDEETMNDLMSDEETEEEK
jgi:hypothetical protein